MKHRNAPKNNKTPKRVTSNKPLTDVKKGVGGGRTLVAKTSMMQTGFGD